MSFENQSVALVPATDAGRATMIRSSLYGNFPSITAANVANGVYDVYLYVWEDNDNEIYSVSVEGLLVQTNYSSGAPGAWAKLGPFRTIVGDGNILITTAGGTANLSGLEIRSVPTTAVAPTGISVSPTNPTVYMGRSVQVLRTITPANATNRSVTWTSSNPSIAMVNNDGWITGIAPGSATITASLAGFSSQATVTVSKIPSSYSTRLNGTAHEKYGLGKSIAVLPGDVITAEVYAKYVDSNTNNWNAVLSNLMATIANGTAPAGTFIDGGAGGSIGGTTFPYIGALARTGDSGTGPKAYLNYLIFDQNFAYKSGGFKRLSAAPKETGTDVAHERLAFEGAQQITITEPGYVYVYISNENDTPVEVYFDDFKVTHTKVPIVSSQDYYPFGLTFNSYSRENTTPNMYHYNGKEKQDELGLEWIDYGARMYMPEIGRWMVSDEESDRGPEFSPYSYAFNSPVRYIDPDGNWPWESKHIRQARRFARETGGEFSKNGNTATVDIYQTTTYYDAIDGYVEAVYPDGYPEEGLTFSDENNIGLIRFEEGGDYDDLFGLQMLEANVSVVQLEEFIVIFPGLAKLLPGGHSESTINIQQLVALILKMSSASDDRLREQAKQQKEKEDKAKARAQGREQQTRQGKTKVGKSNQDVRGSHHSTKGNSDQYSRANARRKAEQAKADKKKQESKKKK